MPAAVRDMVVQPCEPGLDCEIVFSALPADQRLRGRGAVCRRRLWRAEQCQLPPHGPRRAAAHPRGEPRPSAAGAATAQESRLGQGLYRHRPQLLDHRPGAGAQAAARRLWRAAGGGHDDAGALGRRLPRRALARQPGQRRPLHRQRRGQDGARAAQAPRPLFRGAGNDHPGATSPSARPATAWPRATATWRRCRSSCDAPGVAWTR